MSASDSGVLDMPVVEVPVAGAVSAELPPSAAGTDKLDRSFARGIAWLGSVKWLVQLGTWGTTIIVARILTPADYGLLTMATVLLEVLSLLSESGLGLTVVTVREITREQTGQLNGAAVGLGVVSFAVTCLAAWPVSWFYKAPALPLVIVGLGFSLVVVGFRVVPGALLQRDLRFRRLAAIDAAQGVAQAVTTIVLAVLGFRYWSLVYGALVGAAVGTIGTVAARPYMMRWPHWKTLRPLLPFTRNVLVGRLFWFTYQNSDFIVAGKRLGTVALGAYSYAWTLASMPVDKISALMNSVTPPIFAAIQHDIPGLRRYFLTVNEGLAVFAFPLTVGIALVAQDLVPVVFGSRWIFMIAPLQVLAIYSTIRVITPTASQALTVTGDTRYLMYLGGVAAVVLPTAFYIGSRWGTIGIALAWTIAHPLAVYFPLYTRLLRRLELSIPRYFRALWPALSGCLVMSAAVISTRQLIQGHVIQGITLGAEIAAGAIAYSACLLMFHRARVKAFIALWRNPTVETSGSAPTTAAS
ncbi:MAG TPA: lipopolysaccharide biosynthesis protein [Gemmatimonadaceae bacterium]|nr:lipopolysaccharide biosynthesis protein [Gemmatimonadaceae bacterium]